MASRVNKTGHATEKDRPYVLSAGRCWFKGPLDLGSERLVFIDETWTATDIKGSNTALSSVVALDSTDRGAKSSKRGVKALNFFLQEQLRCP
jgi:hypothetical protein